MKSVRAIFSTNILTAVIFVLILSGGMSGVHGDEAGDALKSIKRFVGYIRYSKTKPDLETKALGMIDYDAMSQYLLTDKYYTKASDSQKEELNGYLREYIRLRAFPEGLKYFKDIDLVYSVPEKSGSNVQVKSSITYEHPVEGTTTISFSWVVHQKDAQWVMVDFLDVNGESSMKINRDKQIQPILKKEGVPGLLRRFKAVIKSLE